MKKLPVLVVLISILSVFSSCSSLQMGGGGVEITKAFPNRQLLSHEENANSSKGETCLFLTDSSFEDGKKDFEKFLGGNWIGLKSTAEDNKELSKIVGKNDKTLLVEGSAVFISPKYPGRKIGLMQINKFPTTKLLFIYDDKP